MFIKNWDAEAFIFVLKEVNDPLCCSFIYDVYISIYIFFYVTSMWGQCIDNQTHLQQHRCQRPNRSWLTIDGCGPLDVTDRYSAPRLPSSIFLFVLYETCLFNLQTHTFNIMIAKCSTNFRNLFKFSIYYLIQLTYWGNWL